MTLLVAKLAVHSSRSEVLVVTFRFDTNNIANHIPSASPRQRLRSANKWLSIFRRRFLLSTTPVLKRIESLEIHTLGNKNGSL
jgi:hypothetical protein